MRGLQFVCLCLSLSLFGCTVALSKQQRASLKAVSVAPIENLPGMYHQGPDMTPPEAPPKEQKYAYAELKRVLSDAAIEPAGIFRDSFVQQLKTVHGLPPVQDQGGDAVFTLVVNMWGLAGSGNLTTPNLKPLLSISASLKRPDGTVLWTNNAHITNFGGGTVSATTEAYLKDPDLLRDALSKAAGIVAKELVSTLEER